MVLDEEMVERAQKAAEKLAAAEREAMLARADYHALVRRLHLAGGSMREIAQALGLSHQRIAQIVDEVGGTWWKRMWRNRNHTRDAVCTFCSKPPSEVAKLIAGPRVFICDACVDLAEKRSSRGVGPFASEVAKCSFCAKKKPSVGAHDARICHDCIHLCEQILDGR
jgi:hypothetical protein